MSPPRPHLILLHWNHSVLHRSFYVPASYFWVCTEHFNNMSWGVKLIPVEQERSDVWFWALQPHYRFGEVTRVVFVSTCFHSLSMWIWPTDLHLNLCDAETFYSSSQFLNSELDNLGLAHWCFACWPEVHVHLLLLVTCWVFVLLLEEKLENTMNWKSLILYLKASWL